MDKSAGAFRTISEVSEALDTPAHVLRFWESRFTQIKPVKGAGGRRYYRPSDVALLSGIRKLLHEDGLTIRGVQKILREKGVRFVAGQFGSGFDVDAPETAVVHEISRPVAPRASERTPPPVEVEGIAEAPMMLDAPEAPLGALADFPAPRLREETQPRTTPPEAPPTGAPQTEVSPADGAQLDAPRNDAGDPPVPAAAMLRAMDALRARDKRSELRDVYNRLNALRDRLSGEMDPRSR